MRSGNQAQSQKFRDRAGNHERRQRATVQKRESLGLTQKQLANLLRVADATVSRWETGGQIQQRSMDLLLRAFSDIPALRQYLGMPFTQSGPGAPVAVTTTVQQIHGQVFRPDQTR